MQKKLWGPRISWIVALLVIPIWFLSFPETTIRHNLKPFFVYGSQIAALVGFALFALTFILAARIKWLEDYFGGLDRMYHTHHTMAATALVLLISHPVLLALRWIPEQSDRLFWYLLPLHRRTEINLGSWALLGLVLLMIFTFKNWIPYDKWKISHKFTGVFFILAVLHIYLTDPEFLGNTPLKIYIMTLSILGIAAWIYKSILFDLITTKHSCHVEKVRRINDQVLEIELSTDQKEINYIPGQFYFFSFRDQDLSREAHPFTVCDLTENGHIKIMVKALGDYTSRLHEVLKPGATALLEGPYGRFDFRDGKHEQLWIAGGVGIAPFISWANELSRHPNHDFEIDLYYCVNTKQEAVHFDLFEQLEKQQPGFRVHLVCADQQGFLKPEQISGIEQKEIYICGPKAMRTAILPAIKNMGLSQNQIHYEDFDFS